MSVPKEAAKNQVSKEENEGTEEQHAGNEENDVEFAFRCKLENVRNVHHILTALLFKKEGQVPAS